MSTHLSNIEGMEMAGKLPEVRLASTRRSRRSRPSSRRATSREAIARARERASEDGLRYQTLLRRHRFGQDVHHGQRPSRRCRSPRSSWHRTRRSRRSWPAELKEFFPDNAVVYFVSYYDYYQPEAYVPSVGHLHREGRLHQRGGGEAAPCGDLGSALAAGLHRGGIGVAASTASARPMDYAGMAVFVDKQKEMDRDEVIHELIDIQYDRNDYELKRGTFRVRGRHLDVFPPVRRPSHPHRVLGGRDRVHLARSTR